VHRYLFVFADSQPETNNTALISPPFVPEIDAQFKKSEFGF